VKKIIYLFAGLCIIASCNSNGKTAENTTTPGSENASTASNPASEKDKLVYNGIPIRYSDWEIGNSKHIQTVLELYSAWDKRDESKVGGLFADTVKMRIPTERSEIIIPNNKIVAALTENRGMYDSTYNDILSVVSIHDRESNEDWVLVNTYNKWTEKGGKRDSVLYHDEWRLKNGKVDFLMSYYKLPTKTFLKANDPVK
jgi:ketosteroid isomerase-like protein